MFEFDQNTTDQDRIRGFTKAVYRLLSATLSTGSWTFDSRETTNVRLDRGVKEVAQAALREFNQQLHLDRLLVAIDQATDETLRSHGLSGDQLQFKLTNIQRSE